MTTWGPLFKASTPKAHRLGYSVYYRMSVEGECEFRLLDSNQNIVKLFKSQGYAGAYNAYLAHVRHLEPNPPTGPGSQPSRPLAVNEVAVPDPLTANELAKRLMESIVEGMERLYDAVEALSARATAVLDESQRLNRQTTAVLDQASAVLEELK